eukprot:5461515-Heterocapsa_arctica.AAC.1
MPLRHELGAEPDCNVLCAYVYYIVHNHTLGFNFLHQRTASVATAGRAIRFGPTSRRSSMRHIAGSVM